MQTSQTSFDHATVCLLPYNSRIVSSWPRGAVPTAKGLILPSASLQFAAQRGFEMEEQYPLHSVITQVPERRRQWLEQQGVFLDLWIIEGELQSLLKYLEKKEISKISADELKMKWHAIDREAVEKIKTLLDRGIKVNAKDEMGSTSLRLAVESGNTEVAKVLLENEADMTAGKGDGGTMLHVAVKSGNEEMVNMLLDKGADVTAKEEYGSTTLHTAVRSGNVEMVELLLKRGADKEATEEDGSTVLHVAVSSGNPEMVEFLLNHGADVGAVDEENKTPLHVAACYRNTDIVRALLRGGANVAAVNRAGRTALHFAAYYSNTYMLSLLLLAENADLESVDETGNNPLGCVVTAQQHDLDDESVAVARFLCSRGSQPKFPSRSRDSPLKEHQLGLLTCTHYWHRCYELGKPLQMIPSEVIQNGEQSVETYLDEWDKTSSDELIFRSKICVVGPSTWGKTTLVKSISEEATTVMDTDDRTIGIDLSSFTFRGGVDDTSTTDVNLVGAPRDESPATSKVNQHDVMLWDFAGQDIYRVAHALFFSKRTLYIFCIHLEVYAQKLTETEELTDVTGEKCMNRFFEENVLRWIRFVLLRQPDAQFKLIGTHLDQVSESSLVRKIEIDVKNRLSSFLENPDRQVMISETVGKNLKEELERDLVTTSVRSRDSLLRARKTVEDAIVANSNLSFKMPKTYTSVLEYVFTVRRSAAECITRLERLRQVVVPITQFRNRVMNEVSTLRSPATCRDILLALHNLGDVVWYAHSKKGLQNFIILDPTIMLDIVREVVNHEYDGKIGLQYDALRQHGTLQHSLLMEFPSWKALSDVDGDMVQLFKHLLVELDLAYPSSNTDILVEGDMIVPTYWNTQKTARRKPLDQQQSVLDRHYVNGASIAKWKYSLPVSISETIYVNFVVRCYCADVERSVGKTFFETFVQGEFGAAIHFSAPEESQCDDVTIEVVAATAEIAWTEMRYFIIAMEQVLLDYPGLEPNRERGFGRCIVDSQSGDQEISHEVSEFMNSVTDEERLRKTTPWLPPDFSWFLQCVWKNPGKLEELQLSRQLAVLQKLVVNRDKRRFPAVWTLSHLNHTIELRMHSDLSGKCFHDPLKIRVPSKFEAFLAEHQSFVQASISVLSVASAAIPFTVASTAVEAVLSVASSVANNTCSIKSVLDKAQLRPGEAKSSKEIKSNVGFLRDLLKLYDPTYDEYTVGEASNLRCVVTKNGSYLWVHSSEMQKLDGEFFPCACISLRFSAMPDLWNRGRRKAQTKEIYCDWKICHHSSAQAIEAEQSQIQVDTTASVPLENVDSVEMLRECTLKVVVRRPRRFTGYFREDRVLVKGDVKLEDHVDLGFSGSKTIQFSSEVACHITVAPTKQ